MLETGGAILDKEQLKSSVMWFVIQITKQAIRESIVFAVVIRTTKMLWL